MFQIIHNYHESDHTEQAVFYKGCTRHLGIAEQASKARPLATDRDGGIELFCNILNKAFKIRETVSIPPNFSRHSATDPFNYICLSRNVI